jgi:hypothetical protein
MGINHRCLDVFMSQQFLHRTDIVAILEQMSGKGMAKGVATYSFLNTG